jgi:hypothetical protein
MMGSFCPSFVIECCGRTLGGRGERTRADLDLGGHKSLRRFLYQVNNGLQPKDEALSRKKTDQKLVVFRLWLVVFRQEVIKSVRDN